jgi:uncharacterized Fe-S cluster-containing radical SAM superfamily protein
MDSSIPFDPVARARTVESVVMQDGRRKYYRFRASRHYGGVVTADAVGCDFLCAYCWNYTRNKDPVKYGSFYSPREVAQAILAIGEKRGIRLFRVSGAEPVLGQQSFHHLLEVLSAGNFVLETNGLVLGYYPELIDHLAGRDVIVRVSIKGWDPATFERVTGAGREYFEYPLLAVRHLEQAGIRAWPAVMGDLFGPEGIAVLSRRLARLGIRSRIEVEYLERYPFVMANLAHRGCQVK